MSKVNINNKIVPCRILIKYNTLLRGNPQVSCVWFLNIFTSSRNMTVDCWIDNLTKHRSVNSFVWHRTFLIQNYPIRTNAYALWSMNIFQTKINRIYHDNNVSMYWNISNNFMNHMINQSFNSCITLTIGRSKKKRQRDR